MTASEYQLNVLENCKQIFPGHEIKSEWAAFTGNLYQYSPRVDIAVGPFNVAPGPNLVEDYNDLIISKPIKDFLEVAINFHIQNANLELYNQMVHPEFNSIININQNARCLIAIEIENTNSKKHMMGSIINAASLGRVGIGIAYCASALRTFLRIVNYLNFLRRVGKNTYNSANFLILSSNQFNELIGYEMEEVIYR